MIFPSGSEMLHCTRNNNFATCASAQSDLLHVLMLNKAAARTQVRNPHCIHALVLAHAHTGACMYAQISNHSCVSNLLCIIRTGWRGRGGGEKRENVMKGGRG